MWDEDDSNTVVVAGMETDSAEILWDWCWALTVLLYLQLNNVEFTGAV